MILCCNSLDAVNFLNLIFLIPVCLNKIIHKFNVHLQMIK